MTASRDDTEADAGTDAGAEADTESKTDSEDDVESPFRRAYRRLVDGVDWFREFNRGYSNNSHFLDRKD